jgi:hypothetical protein
MDYIFNLLDTPLGGKITGIAFGVASVICLIIMAVFFVQHAGDECPPNVPKMALAHQACVNENAKEDSLTLP